MREPWLVTLAAIAVIACLSILPLVSKTEAVCIALVLGASAGFYFGVFLASRRASHA